MTDKRSATEILDSVEEEVRRRTRGKKWPTYLTYFLAVGIFPFLESLWTAHFIGGDPSSGHGAIIALLSLIGGHAIAAWLAFVLSTADTFYFEILDLSRLHQDTKEQLRESKESLSLEREQTAVIRLLLLALSHFVTTSETSSRLSQLDIDGKMHKLMIPLIEKREEVIGFQGAHFNIAVYHYYEDDDELRKYYRRAHASIPISNRSFTPSQDRSHIARCFREQKPIFSPDTTVADVLRLPGEDENTPYRSIAVAPIFHIDKKSGTRDARGVFIVTSNKAGQITEKAHGGLVLVVARILSLFLHHADAHIPQG